MTKLLNTAAVKQSAFRTAQSPSTGSVITVVQLYPNQMNIYGDHGNVLAITKRLAWHGYQSRLVFHHPGEPFPEEADIIIGGGGQDSGQSKVQNDLLAISDKLHSLADADVPMLMICGLYQLFGRFFKTADGQTIKGIGMFAAETHAGPSRLIGNVVVDSQFGQLVGYENHSGQTVLDSNQQPLGKIVKGAGNNGQDGTEGAIYRHVYGSYMHGSLLPKNPIMADALITQAILRKYGEPAKLAKLDDSLANSAHNVAAKRPH